MIVPLVSAQRQKFSKFLSHVFCLFSDTNKAKLLFGEKVMRFFFLIFQAVFLVVVFLEKIFVSLSLKVPSQQTFPCSRWQKLRNMFKVNNKDIVMSLTSVRLN